MVRRNQHCKSIEVLGMLKDMVNAFLPQYYSEYECRTVSAVSQIKVCSQFG